jgi:hypothetical protein
MGFVWYLVRRALGFERVDYSARWRLSEES